jgi:hypothetical protein
MHTMYYVNEIRQVAEYGQPANVEVKPQEVKLAQQLVESLAAEWEPKKYHDEYQARLKGLIEAKLAGKEIAETPQPQLAPVIDLMEALKKSLAERQASTPRKPPVRAVGGEVEEAQAVAAAVPQKARRARASSRHSGFKQTPGVGRGLAGVFVFEEGVDVDALAYPIVESFLPSLKLLGRVALAAQARIDEISGEDVGRGVFFCFREAESDAVAAKQRVGFVVVPGGVAELAGEAKRRRAQGKELIEQRQVGAEVGKLNQDGTKPAFVGEQRARLEEALQRSFGAAQRWMCVIC